MHTSLFDLYKIGIGPSSSHTVGPMRAASRFVDLLRTRCILGDVGRLRVELFGSLALTGRGHGTDRGVLLGLLGEHPDTVDPAAIDSLINGITTSGTLSVDGTMAVPFSADADLIWHRDKTLPRHPNGLRFSAFVRTSIQRDPEAPLLQSRSYFSVGGGFVVGDDEAGEESPDGATPSVPFTFGNAEELLRIGRETGLRIDQIVMANECARRSENDVRRGIDRLWKAMQACIDRGMTTPGHLPGGLRVKRRASELAARLLAPHESSHSSDPLQALDWLNVYAIAVNEENAAGGRVVTAPTNGAAGIIPAVVQYYSRHLGGESAGVERFFLASAAIGKLYKENASISGAEVGCQGEVGVACSMAAGGLAAALGGTNEQVEHAAEIGMEHNLGMTCDPIGGLVQIPCIERNAFGAVKAVNAARMALRDTGDHKVSLDQVIKTMYQTGLDMQSRYKETALGGLAVNVIEC